MRIYILDFAAIVMPKVSLDMPAELVEDLKLHVGDDAKFVSLADAIRTACRKLLDQLDAIDALHGRRSL
jgi:Arc/MetJ-type ribon-helix-helix transcriptional regulator